MVDTTRRAVLKLAGSGGVAGLAGCNAPSASDGASGDGAAPATDSPYTRVYRRAVDSVGFVRVDEAGGTGFVFDDGHLVTNAHVVGEASAVDVRFDEGQWAEGEVVGRDPNSDLAAVAVGGMPSGATPLPFAEGAAVGQEVVAIGNPFDLDGTVTTGVISGVDRSIPAPTGFRIPDAVQTDAAVNPGNSGGPLVALDGRVVAVVNSGGGEDIAFGISAPLARRVLPELVETGTYEHAFMGVAVTDITPRIARANNLDEPRGLLVADVLDDGPAAGTLRGSDRTRLIEGEEIPVGGDVLLAVEETDLLTGEDLGSHLALRTRPGDSVELTVLREGRERTVTVEVGRRPD
jgi:S1-C subfamily serine protease